MYIFTLCVTRMTSYYYFFNEYDAYGYNWEIFNE